ncbi:universal stress protein [Pseudonocardia acaciae]|uniref:universal stress protein n=1 Tax=Pseudonocardia acaciae TaxID=551276 RepID=UPI000684501A|nr:universal stress protein [Pseudonocardia acaciae]
MTHSDAAAATVATIVVGYGPGSENDHALVAAADLARRLAARLWVVHVACLEDYPVDPDAADWEERARDELAEHRDHVARLLAGRGVGWDYETRRGDPADELCRVADEHDALLIAVGTRGEGLRTVIPRLFEPSVSHAVIHYQHRPVLVIPPPDMRH